MQRDDNFSAKEMCLRCNHNRYCMAAFKKDHWCGNYLDDWRKNKLALRLDGFGTKAEAIKYVQENIKGCDTAKDAEKYLRDHLPKESVYQKKIMDALKCAYPDAFIWKEAAGPYSRQGIPDVSAVIDGKYYGFEIKRPYIGLLSKIQDQTINKIRNAGGCAGVVVFPEDALGMVRGDGYDSKGVRRSDRMAGNRKGYARGEAKE